MLKLTDFGFAKETTQNALQTPCYTPYYVGECRDRPGTSLPPRSPAVLWGSPRVAEVGGLKPSKEGGALPAGR